MNLNSYLSILGAEKAADLARKLRIHPSLISQWKTHKRPIPAKRAVAIERATNGLVSRQEMRPDDYWQQWPELARPQDDS